MRTAAKKDANHNEIADRLVELGWVVQDLSQLKNCCDMAAAKNFFTVMIEVKDGSKPPSQRKLTKGETEFRNKWCQQGVWYLCESIEDVDRMDREVEIRLFNETEQ